MGILTCIVIMPYVTGSLAVKDGFNLPLDHLLNPLFSFIILLISSALSAASRVVVVASISTDLSYGVDSVTLLVREEEYYVVNFVLSVVRLAFAFSSPIIVFSGHHAAPI